MGLLREHLPFSRSLRDRVVAEYDPCIPTPDNPLGHDELVSYLSQSGDTDASPLTTIRDRAAKLNRSADLSPADRALLTWVCKAFSDWEERYPLEAPLRDQLRRLLPLAVAVALRDEDFTTPGQHPLHQLLDALQAGAVGWQARLEQAGQMLEQRIERAVDKALEWFSDPTLDIGAITRELTAANERDAARAQRMVQRLAETELARLRTLSAQRDAALFINEGLAEYELPSAIGEFLKGPWKDSAQLVLVKYGNDSSQWQQMRRTTEHLLESVQDLTDEDEHQRDRREQILRHLPSELRRWLVSLEHDSDATDSAVGLVEYAHLRLQRDQQLQRSPVSLLEISDEEEPAVRDEADSAKVGEWYRLEDDEGELRAQLVLALENGGHLLFANFVGLKAMDLSRQIFLQRLADGFAVHLPRVCTFSLSLAEAAGIHDEEGYRRFIDPNYLPPSPPEPAHGVSPVQNREAERSFAARDTGAAATRETPDPSLDPEPEPEPEPEPGNAARDSRAPFTATTSMATTPTATTPTATTSHPEPARAAPPPQQRPSVLESTAPPPVTPNPSGWDRAPTLPPPYGTSPPAARGTREVDVPMGAWLGFHDGETPIMAKLAVFDPRRDNYIFVNRKGIALRELNRAELLELMDHGLVDILETRSYFRDEVERTRGENP